MRIILASSSKRRRFLLQKAKLEFETHDANVDERRIIGNSPLEIVKKRALAKASHVAAEIAGGAAKASHVAAEIAGGAAKASHNAAENPDTIVIGADTVVVADGKILGKPKNKNEALEFLGIVTGKRIEAFTGVAVICESKDYAAVWAEKASVKFREISEKAALSYVRSGKWKGKAGGFNIDEKPVSSWVEKITGGRETIIGLPIKRLKRVIENLELEDSHAQT